MEFPSNVKYTKEHEWIRVEGDIAYVASLIMHKSNWVTSYS